MATGFLAGDELGQDFRNVGCLLGEVRDVCETLAVLRDDSNLQGFRHDYISPAFSLCFAQVDIVEFLELHAACVRHAKANARHAKARAEENAAMLNMAMEHSSVVDDVGTLPMFLCPFSMAACLHVSMAELMMSDAICRGGKLRNLTSLAEEWRQPMRF